MPGLNRWIVEQGRDACPGERTRIVELGSGGRVAVRELLRVFPAAKVWGVDPSPIMVVQSRGRNRRAVEDGRLMLIEGDGASAAVERSGRGKR